MNKKYLFGMFAAAALFATSCSNDDIVSEQSGNYVDASFTIDAPTGINSRTIGDGLTANVVKCVVYDAAGKKMDLDQTLTLSGGKATYDIRLVKGQAYRVAFFAYNNQANAYDVTDMKNIQILQEQASNKENRDAFTAKFDIEATATMNPIKENITLYRPFAQLNLGAFKEDIAAAKAAGIEVKKTYVKVTNVYKAFSAYDDKVVGTTSDMEFALNELVSGEDLMADANRDGTDEAYEYLALNYLLVGDLEEEKSLTDVEFIWETKDGEKTNNPTTVFNNIPVQRNYRTNIIGWLLTNPAQFNIVIDAEFTDHDYIITSNGVEINKDGAYEIVSGEGAAWITEQIAEGTVFTEPIMLGDDITVDKDNSLQVFATNDVTIDGNGKTINSTANSFEDFGWDATGMLPDMSTVFASAAGSKVTVSDLNFTGTMGAVMLGIYSPKTAREGEIELNSITIENADVANNLSQGLSSAMMIYNKTNTLNNCIVTGTKISSLDNTNPELFDVIFARYSNTLVNGGEIGTAYVWNVDTYLTVGDGAKIGTITLSKANANNQKKVKVTIKAGATVGTIDLSKYDDGTGIKVNESMIVIEEGATVKFVANGVEYASVAAFNAR